MNGTLLPLTRERANAFVAAHHRHAVPVRAHRFAIGLADDAGELRGVVIVGNPIARHLADGYTAEIVRLTTDGSANACSQLYAAAWRAWRAMGGRRIVTYTLATEPGTSLRAVGWQRVADCPPRAPGRGWADAGRRAPSLLEPEPVPARVRWEAHV